MLDSRERLCSESSEVKLRGASGDSGECLLVIRAERQSVNLFVCKKKRGGKGKGMVVR